MKIKIFLSKLYKGVFFDVAFRERNAKKQK